jgi:hypothetical protein
MFRDLTAVELDFNIEATGFSVAERAREPRRCATK